ncbi:MAG TPA: amidase family protein [Pirellulales bacterium]|nr:amidase family protein [Pirellulales bacterium]
MNQPTRRKFLGTAAAALAASGLPSLATSKARAKHAGTKQLDEFAALDATAQAELVRKKQVTPLELVEAAIARVEKLDPQLNSVVTKCFDQARKRAAEPLGTGPFAGVPFLVKDLEQLKGVRLTYGSKFFKGNISPNTSEVVHRMEQSGLIVIGKSSTPEFGLVPTTEPRAYGATKNPWDLTRSSGGSSGGSAAAVAAGIVPLASASDGGGSIRIPSSCCGLFGLKINRGRNPEAPSVHEDGLSVVHCVSRSVRDSATLLDATRGPTPGERWLAPAPQRPFLEEVGAAPGKLRIAFRLTDFAGNKVHPDCAAAIESTAKLCADLGHHVEEAEPKFDEKAFGDAFLVLWAAVAGRVLKSVKRFMGNKIPPDSFEPWTMKLVEIDSHNTPSDVSLAWTGPLQSANLAMIKFLTTYDLLLTPVLARPPIKLGELDQSQSSEDIIAWLQAYCPFTPLANATGQPAMSVPLYWTAEGLPIGSHFMARHGDEAMLLRLAAQLEEARPWAKRWPAVSAAGASV